MMNISNNHMDQLHKNKEASNHVASYEIIKKNIDQVTVKLSLIKGAFKIIQISECEGVTNHYEIISGKMEECDTGKVYESGDTIVVRDISEAIIFDVLEDTIIIWTTSPEVYGNFAQEGYNIMATLEKIQLKDQYTKDHTLRVTNIAKRLALKLGMNGKDIAHLSLAALAHDLGKITTPDIILNKPGKLTCDEYTIMKNHVLESYELIKDRFQEDVKAYIIQHHERLDGSGYPKALKAHEISFGAKVLAVADSYEAMTAERPYKKKFSREMAFDELKNQSDILFDRLIVETFIKHIDYIDQK